MINFRSYTDLHQTIKNNISKIPNDIDLIVGIPRSGLLVANLISLSMNKPLVDLEGFIEGRTFKGGLRLSINSIESTRIKKVLVIDDSLNSGASLEEAKKKIQQAKLKIKIVYGAIYIKPGKESKVDIYFEHCPLPRLFEWNIFHHDILNRSCVDIDGILCRDPTTVENDDGKKYLDFIKNVEPKICPSFEISHLITCRLEKYRRPTVEWLNKNKIRYKKLEMMQYETKEQRIAANNYSKYKAKKYLESNTDLFIESNQKQADEIFNITKKDVYSFENSKMFSKIYDAYNFDEKDNINVSFFSHSSQLGGAEKSMLELINELNEKQIFSHVVIPEEGPIQEELERNNIPYDIVKLNWWAKATTKGQPEGKTYSQTESFKNLVEYLPKLSLINPGLIYTNTIVTPWGAIAANYLDKPHIWHIREFGELDHKLKFELPYAKTIKYIEKNSEELIFNSKAVSKYFSNFLSKIKTHVAHNFIEINPLLLKESVDNPFKEKDSLKILHCASIQEGKNQLEAVRTVVELSSEGHNIELLLLGSVSDKDYLNEISQYIKNNKAKNYIHILGFTKNPYPYFKLSDVILITSYKEAFGRTIVEGMLANKAVVTTKEGGTSEIIKNNITGFTYPTGNIKKLKKIIISLKNKKLRNKIAISGCKSLIKINNRDEYGYKISEIIKKQIINYQPHKKNFESIIKPLNLSIQEIKNENIVLEKEIIKTRNLSRKYQKNIDNIINSKYYKIWRKYCQLKDLIK